MNIKLEDIIDLDYLVGLDEALSTDADIRQREEKDKKIFEQSKNASTTDEAFLLSWLEARRQELSLLPGRVFSSLYSFMVYALVFFGSITGLSLSWSFLAYHGTRPVNVALFISLFIVLQVVLITITVFLLIKRHLMIGSEKGVFKDSVINTLLSSLFFNLLPELLKKTDWHALKKGVDTLEYTSVLIRMKNREYGELFFWPFFILTSVFSFSFTASTLAGTFFRVIVSDMAFGWQSTLMTTSVKIHQLVSLMALPWSWFMPKALAHPSLEQIEGSRIILKDGISVLATQDLISWWPFLCMGILFYAVLPRAVLMIAGIMVRNRVLLDFGFNRPVFRQLLIRMKSPVLDIDTAPSGDEKAVPDQFIGRKSTPEDNGQPRQPSDLEPASHEAFILVPGAVYSDEAMGKIVQAIKNILFLDVKETIQTRLDPDQDKKIFDRIEKNGTDKVVLVHEAWQPPIRGLLYYIGKLKSAMPEKGLLWVLLTGDAEQENLCVDETDADFDIWKKAVFKLQDPGIKLVRLK